ncbi:preprotein translocase subunit SecG [Parvularcula sp. ZS-1/3]|uniref:Protein-export membrane protein SecG n=1 Tax=Parvularcula mediterranea TaxID=2732508 RepID=A0A7Y3RP81_9PROT|nr:preprotein translocase subunit SecG [Parvularcula mediterranea]NNU17719.1 preprotein translocase subunit SecG [Parvularcula mediterranea]
MTAIILTIQAMIVLALIGVVLLQRSDGAGGLGMGGGGGGGGMMSARGTATALTRATSVLAALFFANSLVFSLVVDRGENEVNFLPIEEQGELGEQDFTDILGPGEDEAPEAEAPDAFTLPDDLGASGETQGQEEDEPQR